MTGLAARVPWWAKIAAKMALTHLPFAYGVWRRIGLFRAGAMDDIDYARRNLEGKLALVRADGGLRDGFRLLEVGPGDSVLTGVMAPAFGAGETVMVDVAPMASRDVELYRRAAAELRENGFSAPELAQADTLEAVLAAANARYLTRGTDSLVEIEDGSVDVAVSTAVLEHVRLGEFDHFMAELRRISAPGAVHVHTVDLRDHLATNLHNLRFSQRRWESPLMAEAGFYTNRIRFTDMVERFERAGFSVEIVNTMRWPGVPLPRRKMHPEFAALPDDELTVAGFTCVLRPV